MPGGIDLIVEVHDREVLARLSRLPDELLDRLQPIIERLTAEMYARVIAAEPKRSGALMRATRQFVDRQSNLIRGRVRILGEPGGPKHNVKAAALEYGAHGNASVREHEMSLDHVFDIPIDPEEVLVSAYNRDVNITADRFLRDALIGIEAQFEAEIEHVIAELTL